MKRRNVPGTMMVAALAASLAGCELNLIDPHFGQDMSVYALGADRWEVRASNSLSQADVFEAVESECGGQPIVESRESRPDDPDSWYMVVRCLRPAEFPPPRDPRLQGDGFPPRP